MARARDLPLTLFALCVKVAFDVCVFVTGLPESNIVSSRGKPPSPQPSPPAPTSLLPKLLHGPIFTFHSFVSDRVILHCSQTSSTFVLFFCFCIFLVSCFVVGFFFLLLSLLCMFGCGVCVRVCVCVCCSLQLPPLITVPLQTDAAPG